MVVQNGGGQGGFTRKTSKTWFKVMGEWRDNEERCE